MVQTADSRAGRRWFTIGVILLVIWAVAMILAPLRLPIAWAALLAFLLHPLQVKLTRRLRNRPNAAAARTKSGKCRRICHGCQRKTAQKIAKAPTIPSRHAQSRRSFTRATIIVASTERISKKCQGFAPSPSMKGR